MFLLAITAYGYRQLDQRGILGLSGWQGEDPLSDPLLLLAPTLYLFTAPLLALNCLRSSCGPWRSSAGCCPR